jgi:predicted nucleic acid-binding protein
MGTSNYLVDTNILIEYLGNTLSENATRLVEQIFEESLTISIINKIELLGFSKLTFE